MRLVTYLVGDDPRLGAEYGDAIIDINRALAVQLAEEGEPRPDALANVLVPPEMLAFLRSGDRAAQLAREAYAHVVDVVESGRDGEELRHRGVLIGADAVEHLAPVPRPRQIVAVGRNYKAHAKELGEDVPTVPVLFAKLPSAVTGPDHPIVLEGQSDSVDYEGELAVVIGKRAHHVTAKQAPRHVAGYTICNDVSARDYQYRTGQFLMGKSFDTFCPMGPALVTTEDIADPHALEIETRVNGEVRQHSNTKHVIFSIGYLIEFMSNLWTLEPGDVILTGTPAGVAKGMDPPRYLQPGDVVEVTIQSIGTLRNPVVAAKEN